MSFAHRPLVTPRQRREMGWGVKEWGGSERLHVMCGIGDPLRLGPGLGAQPAAELDRKEQQTSPWCSHNPKVEGHGAMLLLKEL